MALMMVLMVILLAALPGGHMGGGAVHHLQDRASQPHTSDAAKPVQKEIPQSAGHDAEKPNQAKR